MKPKPFVCQHCIHRHATLHTPAFTKGVDCKDEIREIIVDCSLVAKVRGFATNPAFIIKDYTYRKGRELGVKFWDYHPTERSAYKMNKSFKVPENCAYHLEHVIT